MPAAVGKLGVTWSPVLEHSSLGDGPEKGAGVGWTRTSSESGSREARRVRVGIVSPENTARAYGKGFLEEAPPELGPGEA